MKNFMSMGQNAVGFGATREAADYDLLINKCRRSLEYDTDNVFTARRQELKPWMPAPNMLHIHGIGCLIYEGCLLYNTKTNKSATVGQSGRSIYYYIANILGDEVSYTDITVVLRPELDKLFANMKKGFVAIKDMPPIKRMNGVNGFEPNVVYNIDNEILVGVSDDAIGMKEYGDEAFNVVEVDSGILQIPLLSYIGYKMGYIFDAEGVRRINEEA